MIRGCGSQGRSGWPRGASPLSMSPAAISPWPTRTAPSGLPTTVNCTTTRSSGPSWKRGGTATRRDPTQTILHLYEEEGERCVEQLRGMFAFAIWDRGRRRLLLARDRLGIKPLYYAVTDQELLFGSEIKAILAAGVRVALNEPVLPELLATG